MLLIVTAVPLFSLVALSLACFLASVAGVRMLLLWLPRKAAFDIPNHRSSHTVPTLRGGGLAVVAVTLGGWAWIFLGQKQGQLVVWAALLAAGGLSILSWIDDQVDLTYRQRLPFHVLAVALAVLALPADWLVFQDIVPLWADRVATILCWVWFVNLYNFMDGLDGVAGVETVSLGVGVALVALLAAARGDVLIVDFPALGLVCAAAALGFLVFNWYPARLFLGDVGSITLGYLLGFVLVLLAINGWLAAALILPAYPVVDATVTLAGRLMRGKSPFQAHREHFYQRAVHVKGLRHDQVATRIALGNVVLIGAAALSVTLGLVYAVPVAVVAVAAVLVSLISARLP